MNYREIALRIIDAVGGKENIEHLVHCSTRLRFTLKDNELANEEELKKIEGVIGVKKNIQCQVIIGNDVMEVYSEARKILGDIKESEIKDKKKRKKIDVVMDFIISIFQPLIPAIAGGGILQSLLLLLSSIGIMDVESSTFQILKLVGSAPLYFLPILVASTTANKLKVNQIIAMSAVGALLLPGMTELLVSGTTLFTFDVQNIAYHAQVFPAILTVLLYAQMERFFTKYSFKSIRIFFVPMMSLIITVPISLLVLGPLGFNIGTIFSAAILALYTKFGWIATAVLAALLPLMVVTGMHKAMLPYALQVLGETGTEFLYLPASLAHNISESGACFAVWLKTKDKKLKSTALSAGISALFGITEPALYGVTITHKRVLYSVIISSLVGGAFAGITTIKAFAIPTPGIASLPMFIDPNNSMNLVWAVCTLGVSFVVSFIAAVFLFKDSSEVLNSVKEMTIQDLDDYDFSQMVKGEIIPLFKVNDDIFSSGMIGDGFGVLPFDNLVTSPGSGVVTMIFDTKHAVGLKLDNGIELLIHIGIDTVNLEGEGFKAYIKVGDRVSIGDKLIEFDKDIIEGAGFDPVVVCLVTNKDEIDIEQVNLNFASQIN